MREIKFRAWDILNRQMVNVLDRFWDTPYNEIFSHHPDSKCIKLMQYTGLKDKNGVEIYEGDVVHMGDPRILYAIEWVDTGLKACQRGNKSTAGIQFHQKWIEVIGNIHQNAELLNQQ